MTTDSAQQSATARAALLRRGFLLEYLTLGWNVIGTGVVVAAGARANSIALVGFGIDSLIEIFASVIVIWQLAGVAQQREQRALRLIGVAFFALAAYVLVQALRSFLTGTRPDPSPLGLGWLAATLVVMLLLAWGKQRTGEGLNNPVLLTESRVTLVDAYLAGAVLLGSVANALAGWWWADPLAGLVIVFYGLREGLHAWREGA